MPGDPYKPQIYTLRQDLQQISHEIYNGSEKKREQRENLRRWLGYSVDFAVPITPVLSVMGCVLQLLMEQGLAKPEVLATKSFGHIVDRRLSGVEVSRERGVEPIIEG